MERLPNEMLMAIFDYLSESDRLAAALTCSRWFSLLKNFIPNVNDIHIVLDASACYTRFLRALPSETVISICLCTNHARQHANLLQLLIRSAGKRLRTLAIEDTLIPKGNVETQIPDTTFHSVVNDVPRELRTLHFLGVDLSKIRPWTFALLIKLNSLEELHVTDTVFPFDNESLLARMMSASYDTLTSVSVTNSDQITDKFASTLARRCPLLQNLNLNGCKNITALSVLAFVENASHRTAELTFIHVHATMFSFSMLQKCLLSPLLAGGNYWKANAIKLEIGFEHDVIGLENTHFTNLFIVVFV